MIPAIARRYLHWKEVTDRDFGEKIELSCRKEISMETRRNTRLEESAREAERKEGRNKLKSIAKEEKAEEVFEIQDHTEEEEERYEADRDIGNPTREVGEMSRKRLIEDSPEDSKSEGQYRRGHKRNKGASIMSSRGNKCGRGQSSNRRGTGRGQNPRGRGRWRAGRQRRRPVISLDRKIQHAKRAYNTYTNPKMRRIIQNMEEEAIQAQSDSEMEDWEFLLPDPGNTRSRMTLFKQSIHVYWVMK